MWPGLPEPPVALPLWALAGLWGLGALLTWSVLRLYGVTGPRVLRFRAAAEYGAILGVAWWYLIPKMLDIYVWRERLLQGFFDRWSGLLTGIALVPLFVVSGVLGGVVLGLLLWAVGFGLAYGLQFRLSRLTGLPNREAFEVAVTLMVCSAVGAWTLALVVWAVAVG